MISSCHCLKFVGFRRGFVWIQSFGRVGFGGFGFSEGTDFCSTFDAPTNEAATNESIIAVRSAASSSRIVNDAATNELYVSCAISRSFINNDCAVPLIFVTRDCFNHFDHRFSQSSNGRSESFDVSQ